MSDRSKVGQMIMAVARPGSDGLPDDSARRAVQELRVGSIIDFDLPGAEAAARFNNRLQSWARSTGQGIPLLVGVDDEFGMAHRIRGATAMPLAMGIGAARRAADARTAARVTAQEAKAMGFRWGFAPVADVNTNPSNPVIGVRSMSSRADLVARLVGEQVIAFADNDLLATPKHFPGHGDTSTDSHTGLPQVTYGWNELWKVHLKPFREAVAQGAEAIMTAHVIVRSVDANRPATLSRKVIGGILRERMGFDGIVISDAMTMAAIRDRWGIAEAARLAAAAGVDVILSDGSFVDHLAVRDALLSAVRNGKISNKRLERSARRVLTAKCRYGAFDKRFVSAGQAGSEVGSAANRRAAAAVARRSITLVKNNGALPLGGKGNRKTLVASVLHTSKLAAAVRDFSSGPVATWAASSTSPSDAEIDAAVNAARAADRVIVGTYSRSLLPSQQAELVRRLVATGKPVIAVSLGLPYDVARYPKVDAYLCAYAQGPWPQSNGTVLRAAMKVVFGADPGGKLPVRISDRYDFGRGLTYR